MQKQVQQAMLERQLEEYERLYQVKMLKSSKFLNSPTFKSLPQNSPVVMEAQLLGRGKIQYGPAADTSNGKKFQIELRLFDGRLNETKE